MRLALRVAHRFLEGKAGGPQITVSGRRYTLSDYWPGMSDLLEGLGAGGAKIIQFEHDDPVTGILAKYKYLWAYDTERMEVDMWRHTDGNHKVSGKASQLRRELQVLQKKGQLNHVTTSEMKGLDRWARGKQDAELKALKQYNEEHKDELERRVEKLVQDWFDRKLVPKMEAGMAKVDKGWRPQGFKVRESLLDFKDEVAQAKSHVISDVLREDFSQENVDKFVEDEFDGLDVNLIGDIQLTYWVRNDVMDKFFESRPEF